MTTQTAEISTELIQSDVANELAPYELIQTWPAGRVLFREGAAPNGVWFLHSGEVTLQCSSPRGETKSLMFAHAGQVLGLTALLSGRGYECTATTSATCVTGYIDRERFLKLLDAKPALWLMVLRTISSSINACWDCMRSLSATHH